jgi:RNA polymerase sigma-70 factor (ECF subfamily)
VSPDKSNPDAPSRGTPRVARENDLSHDSTIHVLERAKNGDDSAARILVGRAVPLLRRWAHGRIPSYSRGYADTDDDVQDAVLQTLKRIKAFEHRSVAALQAYLRESVLNGIRDVIRRTRRRGIPTEPTEDLPDNNPSPLEAAIMKDRSDRFLAALQRLRPADRLAIVWRIELGYSAEEIAKRLGKSTDAARMTINRAVARLAKEMNVNP